MEFTVKADDFRKALLQASIHGSKSPELYNKVRLEFANSYCVFACSDSNLIIRTKIAIYNSTVPEGTILVLKDFNNLLRTSNYLYFPIVTIELLYEINKILVKSGEKRFYVAIDSDADFAHFEHFNEYSAGSDSVSYDIAIMERRFKKIRYAADKTSTTFNRVYFNENKMYATDSKRIALSTSDSFLAKFDFSVTVDAMELICNTLTGIFDLYKNNGFLIFKDNYFNEVIIPVGEAPCFDYKNILNLKYKHSIKTNAKLFSASLEFLESYLENKKSSNNFIGISWRDETLRYLSEQNEVETKIPISQNFGFTISFSLKSLLGCLKQFRNDDIEILINNKLAPIMIHSCEGKEDECIVVPLNTKIDPFEIE